VNIQKLAQALDAETQEWERGGD